MFSTKLMSMPAWQIAKSIRDKQLSPVEVTNYFLERIKATNSSINAFITIAENEARVTAAKAESSVMAGEEVGPLHGVPISIKDLSATKGLRTTFGTLLSKDWVPKYDDIPVERLRAAGAIIIGKTNTPEFGWKATTENLLTGACRNPWDLSRTPGGSSGGSAYCASKAGVISVTEALACELAPHGIHVNAIAPGPTATPGNEHLRCGPAGEGHLKRLAERTRSGRPFSDADDMARAALFLVSEGGVAMHGSVMLLDEGASLA